MGVITSIRVNTDFLVETFEALAADGSHGNVLISGTADYGMLAHLRHGYGSAPFQATVLDLCETPLFLNRWYGGRYGTSVATVRSDVLEHETAEVFDVICTHNFLGRFDPTSRRRVIAKWRALLRPGGALVTTQRVEPNLAPESQQEADERAHRLRDRVLAAAAARSWSTPDAEAIGNAAYEGWRRRADIHRIRTTREITDALTNEGFDVVRLDEGGGAVERAHDRGTPTYSDESYRMRLVARRR
jgi:SAM-dependent methyltransferase